MAFTVDKVIVELEARIAAYEARLTQAERKFTSVTGAIEARGKSTASMLTRTFTNFGAAFGLAFGGTAAAGAVAAFIQIADRAKQLDSQLKLATSSFGEYARAQEDVRRISMETRTGLEETTRLYAVFMRSANELGITQTEAARATETISKAFLISGASAVEASQGTRQLIQAIQSGTLRGDEFNTIMEQAPRLARLFADSLGVPVTALRGLAAQGKITVDTLLAALTQSDFTGKIDQEFSQLPITFDQAMQQVSNAALITFSAFDRGGEFSNMLVNFVTGGAENFAALENRAEIMGGNLRSTISALYNVFDPIGDNAISVMDLIESAINDLRKLIGNTLRDLQNLANMGPTAVGLAVAGPAGSALLGRGTAQFNFADQYQQNLRRNDARNRQRRINNFVERLPTTLQDFAEPRGNRAVQSQKPEKSRGRKGKSAEQIAAEAERAAIKAERDQERFDAEIENLNRQLLSAKAAQATAAADVAKFQIQQIEAERDSAIASIERASTGKDRRYSEEQAKQLIDLQNRIAQEQINEVQSREAQRIAQERTQVEKAGLQNQIDLLESDQRFLRTREQQKDAALYMLDLQYELQRIELEAIVHSQTATDAERQIAEEKLRILGVLKRQDQRAVEQQYQSPGQKYLADLQFQAANLNDELEQLAVDKVRDLGTEFGRATAKAFGLKGALGDLVAKLAEMAFQQAILLPLMRSLFGGQAGGLGGGIGGLLGTLGSIAGIAGGGPSASVVAGAQAIGNFGLAGGGTIGAGQTRLVGERGPELFKPDVSGRIIPNHKLASFNNGGGNGTVEVRLMAGEYFDARVVRVSGPVAARVVAQATPQVTDMAMAKTVVLSGRPSL